MRLIGLSGYAQSGKDTVVGILAEVGFQRVSFADVLRRCAYALNPIVSGDGSDCVPPWPTIRPVRYAELVDAVGHERAKLVPEVRDLLQRLGTDAGRLVLGADVWVNAATGALQPGGLYAFSDVRFPNEAAAVRSRGGQVWRVRRPGSAPINAHPSETALDGYPFDVQILNNGTVDDLRRTVLTLAA